MNFLGPHGGTGGYVAGVHHSVSYLYSVASFRSPGAEEGVVYERNILEGDLPSLASPPLGCAFHTRCLKAMDICRLDRPELKEVESSAPAVQVLQEL
jgi:oligopeptide/dipeptide ABC transporter ATP-binding protein